MRDPAREREVEVERIRLAKEAERLRMAEKAEAVFKTKDGAELLEYLCRKYHIRGRSFLNDGARTPCCPYAAATRDGEKAAIWHLIDLARIADPEFPIP